jgi:hypothetical protein
MGLKPAKQPARRSRNGRLEKSAVKAFTYDPLHKRLGERIVFLQKQDLLSKQVLKNVHVASRS